jgi:hypothetical protein
MIKGLKRLLAEFKQREYDREWGQGYRTMQRVMKDDVQLAAEWFSEAIFNSQNAFEAGVAAAWEDRAERVRLHGAVIELRVFERRWNWLELHARVMGEECRTEVNGVVTDQHVVWTMCWKASPDMTCEESIDAAAGVKP